MKVKNNKYINTLLVSLTVVFLLVTLSGSLAVAETEITIWEMSPSETERKYQKEVVDGFNETHPNIQAKTNYVPFENYATKTITMLEGKGDIAVFAVNAVDAGIYAAKGLLYPLGNLIKKSEKIKKEDFLPHLWERGKVRGKMLAVPLDTDARTLIYNKKMFKENNVEPFGDTVTWDEMLKKAKKLTKPDKGQFGYAAGFGQKWVPLYAGYGNFVLQNEANFLNEAGTRANFTNNPKLEEAISTWIELFKSTTPPDAISWMNHNDYGPLLADGKVGMMFGGPWALKNVLEISPKLEYGLTNPKPKGGKIASTAGGWLLGIGHHLSEEKAKAAFEFVEYVISNTEKLKKWTGRTSVTSRKDNPFQGTEYEGKDAFMRVAKSEASGDPIKLNPALPGIANALLQELQKTVQEQQSLDQALVNAEETANKLLKEYFPNP